jgi:hypothetical protein
MLNQCFIATFFPMTICSPCIPLFIARTGTISKVGKFHLGTTSRCTRVPVSIILYLCLDIGPLILHTNSRQGKNAPQILDSNSRQKKILVIESTVTKVRFNDESSMF